MLRNFWRHVSCRAHRVFNRKFSDCLACFSGLKGLIPDLSYYLCLVLEIAALILEFFLHIARGCVRYFFAFDWLIWVRDYLWWRGYVRLQLIRNLNETAFVTNGLSNATLVAFLKLFCTLALLRAWVHLAEGACKVLVGVGSWNLMHITHIIFRLAFLALATQAFTSTVHWRHQARVNVLNLNECLIYLLFTHYYVIRIL